MRFAYLSLLLLVANGAHAQRFEFGSEDNRWVCEPVNQSSESPSESDNERSESDNERSDHNPVGDALTIVAEHQAAPEDDPRTRQQRLKDQHREVRSDSPWMLGVWMGAIGTPRTTQTGDGEPFGAQGVRAFYGGGLMITLGNYLKHWLRLDGQISAASIGRDEASDRIHGIETTAGVALSMHSATFPRMGLGLGVDLVHAREANDTDNGRFTWWGVRFRWIHEMMFFTHDGFVSGGIQITPTFTYVPYTKRFNPGALLGFNLHWGA